MHQYRITNKLGSVAVIVGFIAVTRLTASPAITVYNDNFGLVRDTVYLQLDPGGNEVSYTGVTAELEPESVVLRDPAGLVGFSVLEQSYRGDPLDEARLLELFEGQEISFLKRVGDTEAVVEGRILRLRCDS